MATIPNILTFSRILAVPLIVGTFYIPSTLGIWITFAIFCAAAVTDFLDGWLARRLEQTSKLGQALDPIADKLLVVSVLVMLLAESRVSEIVVVIILTREFLVAGIRESLAGRVTIPVTQLSKWKTAGQLIAIGILVVAPAISFEIDIILQLLGEILLWIVAIITWITALPYIFTAYQTLSKNKSDQPSNNGMN